MNFLICGVVVLQLPDITEVTFGVFAFRQSELRATAWNFSIVVYLLKQFDPFKFVWYQISVFQLSTDEAPTDSLENEPFVPLSIWQVIN